MRIFTAYFNFNKLDNKILIKYLVSEKENAKNIYNDIAKKLNLDNMPHLEISYKQVIKESVWWLKKKVCISYDHENDKRYRYLLEAWDANDSFEFAFNNETPNEIKVWRYFSY